MDNERGAQSVVGQSMQTKQFKDATN